MQPGGMLLTEAAIAVAALIALIVRVRLSPFIALTRVARSAISRLSSASAPSSAR
jgi:H+/gluconate symporter-like permease